MNSFTKDIENKTIRVVREFKAPQQKVWDAWTKAELLDQWWGPKPWNTRTKSMDFKAGGHWLYAMVGPEGETHWSAVNFTTVDAPKGFSSTCRFSDENGQPVNDTPPSHWTVAMSEKDGVTTVNVTLTFDNVTGLEKMVQMGFEGGFTMGLNQLEELLG
jgi:uncharacterized protein YndB with AHSA1/START domain